MYHKSKYQMQSYKFLENNIEENLHNLGFRDDFLYMTTRA
jgi:hypothetical protein